VVGVTSQASVPSPPVFLEEHKNWRQKERYWILIPKIKHIKNSYSSILNIVGKSVKWDLNGLNVSL
jgi:hypothetical protein